MFEGASWWLLILFGDGIEIRQTKMTAKYSDRKLFNGDT